MAKLPAFQFYPGDWMKDPGLRRCSKAAKGVWIDMICLSFECEERGVFSSKGLPWPDDDIAAAVGGDHAENLRALDELLAKGVCSRNQAGAVFCRRVVRDEQKRRLCSEAGKKGGGNPDLYRSSQRSSKGHPKGHSKGGAKASTSSSTSSSILNTPPPPSEMPAIVMQPFLDTIEPDPMEIEFITAWNSTKGAIRCKQLSRALRNEFYDRLSDPVWAENWKLALAKFPLPFWEDRGGVGIATFLDPKFVDKTLGNSYAKEISRDGNRTLPPGALRAPEGKYDHLGG